MSCQVKYNKDNTIRTVFDQNGNESILFNQIASLPHVKSKEEALSMYKETLKFQENKTVTTEYDQVLTEIIEKLKKTGLTQDVITDVSTIDIKVRELKKEGLVKDSIEVGDFNGFVHENIIYLSKPSADTVIHEFAHLWYAAVPSNIKNKGKELIKGTKYYDNVEKSSMYSNMTEEQKLEEALVQAIGEKGAKIVESNKKKDFISWLKNLWSNVKKSIGITDIHFDLANANLAKYTEAVANDLLKGKPLSYQKANFFSNAVSAIYNLKDKNQKNTVGWIKQLTDFQKNGGVKNVNQEITWIGLEEYLNEWVEENQTKKGNIPFEVVEQYIKDNQIEITEVSKEENNNIQLIDAEGNSLGVFKSVEEAKESVNVKGGWLNTTTGERLVDGEGKTLINLIKGVPETNTKYSDYTLEGGENYREVLLTLPNKPKNADYKVVKKKEKFFGGEVENYHVVDKEGKTIKFFFKESDADTFLKNEQTVFDDGYKSSHWDESNILAHIRVNERTLPNGERILFLEEIQSDFAQQGKKDGFKDKKLEKEISNLEKKVYEKEQESEKYRKTVKIGEGNTINDYKIEYIDRVKYDEVAKEGNRLGKLLSEKRGQLRDNPVPNMPYKKTDQWMGMAMRKVYQMAAQEGFDRIAWVTGEQSADRYDLSKQVESIDVQPKANGDKFVFINMASAFNTTLNVGEDGIVKESDSNTDSEYVGKNLSDIIGKELAEKIVNIENTKKEDYTYSDSLEEDGKKGVGFLNKKGQIAIFSKNKKEADKALQEVVSEIQEEGYTLEGNDLKVGGEGMKTFYNSILPKVAKKEAQRFDKQVKVEVVDFTGEKKTYNEIQEELQDFDKYPSGSQERAELRRQQESAPDDQGGIKQQLSIPITDKMKESLNQPIPLFQESSKSDNLETPLQFKTNNKTFDTYKESLQEGSDIEVGIETKDGFKPLIKIPYNVNPNTLDGFINKYIKEDILKGEKIEYLGKTYYKPDGVDYIHERINEHIVKEDLNAMHGSASVKAKDGLIEIIEPQKKESLDENHLKILKGLAEEFTRKLDTPKVSIRPQLSSDDLQLKLLNVLNKLGVETLSISNYIEKYKIKHGVEPSATALADIANRVVAFKDGTLRLEDLTEETMSFIIEALDPKVTENLLRNITQSEEYAQFSEQYREVYGKESPNLTSEELENKVRKEVLSKIMKNATLRLQSTPIQQNFYQKAIEFIKNFFDKISSTNYRQELSLINDMVEDMFIRDNISDYIDSDNITSSFRFYNLGTQGQSDPRLDKMKVLNKALLEQIEQSIISAKRGGASLADTVVKLKTYKSRNEELLRGEAALNFSRMTKNLINFVKSELETAKEQDTVLTLEARDVLSNLKGNIRELLNAIKESSKPLSAHQIGIVSDTATTTESSKAKDLFQETLKEITEEINSISGNHKLQEDAVFDNIVDRMIERYDLPESYRDFARNQAVNMNKEISVFMHFFGQMNNSSDVLLNLTSSLIEEMQGKSTEAKQKLFREFADKMDKAGVSAKDMQEFAKDGYIYNMFDFKKFNEKKLDTERIAYSIAKGKTEVKDHFTLEEYLKLKGDSFYPDMTIEEFNIYQDEYEKRIKTEKESANDESYYEALKEKHNRLGISKETQKFLNTLSYERGRVQRKVMDENNRPIYTEKEKSLLESYAASRTETKQMYSEMGILKQGIIEHTKPPFPMEKLNKTFFEKNGLYYTLSDDAGTEATISFDLHKLDAEYNNSGDKSIDFEAFIKTGIRIQEEEGLSKAIDFYKNNLGIVFTDKFWSQSEGNSLDEYGDHEAVYEIRRLQNRLSDLKKQNKNHQNAAEIEGHNMTITAQEKVQQLSRDLELAYERLPKLKDKKQQNNNYKISANASYYKLLKIKGIEKNTEEEFIEMRKHMTPRNFERAESLWYLANSLDKGGKVTFKKQAERLEEIKKEYRLNTNKEAALHLNRQKLLPYFKRVTPENYITIDEIVSAGKTNGKSDINILSEIKLRLNKMSLDDNFDFNVHYTFKEQESKAINPNYNPEFKGGIEQPKLSKYKNEEFFQEFGMVEVKKGDRITYEPTRNLKKYETLQEVYKLKQSLFDMMEVSNAENMYKLPQMSKTNTNKLIDLLTKGDKKKTLTEIFKDFTEYRVDDMEYGAKDDLVSSGTKVIPKLYVKDLENESDVSDDLFYSLLAMTEQASLYKARKEGLSDVLAIEDKMLSRNSPTNKTSDSTSNYKMFKSFMDYNYFGVKESMQYKRNIPGLGERDLTKLFRLFHKYIRVRNLGFNVVVPLTSWITGEANWVIEKKIGEYVSKDSANMAKSEFYGKLAKDAMKSDNSLGYNDKSKWNVLGEFLDVFDMSQKAENAKYGKGARLLGNLSMVSHQVGNFPIIPKVVLATVMDYRVIKGAIVSKTKFDRDNSTLSKSEKEAEWRKYSDKTLYSFLDVKPTGVTYKPELLEQLDKGQEYVDSKMLGIRNVIKDRLQKIDGQIPESQKLAAQRHALLTFLTTHKGWLSINLQRRFKGTQWNIENNQLEQGSYTTLGSLLSETASNMRNYNEGIIKSLKKAYNNPKSANKIFQTETPTQEQLDQASDLIKRNMKRLGVDMAAMGIFTLIAAMVSAAADDEDLKDVPGMQLTNLLMLRLANEMASTQTGIVGQTYETTKVPIVGMSQIVDGFLDIPDLFDTDKVETGNYGGYSKQYRYLFKNIPGLKSMHDLREIEKTVATYKYYNDQNINIGSLFQYTLWDKIIND